MFRCTCTDLWYFMVFSSKQSCRYYKSKSKSCRYYKWNECEMKVSPDGGESKWLLRLTGISISIKNPKISFWYDTYDICEICD